MKTYLTTFFVLFLIITCISQELTVSVSSGYNFPFSEGNLKVNYTNKLVSAFGNAKAEQHTYSLGAGINYDFVLRYRFNSLFGLKLGLSYLDGAKQRGVFNSYNSPSSELHITTYAQLLRLNTGFFVNTSFGKFVLRPEFGVNIGWGEMYFNQESTYEGNSEYIYVNRYSGGFTLGLSGALTCLYPVNKYFQVRVSANFISGFYTPRTFRCLSAKSGGNDLPMETCEREGTFEKYPVNTNDPNKPIQLVRENFASGSLGIQIGIQWTLWKKEAKAKAKE